MATPHIAFDPLQAEPLNQAAHFADEDSAVATLNLSKAGPSQDMQLSLESSLEALASHDAKEPQEADTLWEQFDLDEVDSEEGFVSSRKTRAKKPFSFSLRNVVVACGLVVGGFVLLWTHDLMSPSVASENSTENLNTARLTALHSPQNADSPLAEPQTQPTAPPPPPAFTPTTPNDLAPTASTVAASKPTAPETVADTPENRNSTDANSLPNAGSAAPAQEEVGFKSSVAGAPSVAPAQSVAPPTQTFSFSGAVNDDSASASRNGSPFLPGHAARRDSAAIVALPPAPTNAPLVSEMAPRAVQPAAPDEKAMTKDNKAGRQRPRFRPRPATENTNAPFPQMWPRKRGENRPKPQIAPAP